VLQLPEYEQPIRDAFAFYGDFEPSSSFFYHLTAPLGDAFAQQEELKRNILSPQTQIVSFDVFDTLIQRPFLRPTDLFSFLNSAFNRDVSSYVDFTRIRMDAEAACREQKMLAAHGRHFDDITLDEIYAEIARTHLFAAEKLARIKQLEMELEVRFCEARPGGQDLYQLAQDSGKRIILCTDMYLPRSVLEAILAKNQYTGYEKLYLSSEIKVTKAQKTLYPYVAKDLGCPPPKNITYRRQLYA
jgi:predicted HAD superfamily hydrolase